MALYKGIWDSKPRGTNIKGTNLKSLTFSRSNSNGFKAYPPATEVQPQKGPSEILTFCKERPIWGGVIHWVL